jgi:hypothetical protein
MGRKNAAIRCKDIDHWAGALLLVTGGGDDKVVFGQAYAIDATALIKIVE